MLWLFFSDGDMMVFFGQQSFVMNRAFRPNSGACLSGSHLAIFTRTRTIRFGSLFFDGDVKLLFGQQGFFPFSAAWAWVALVGTPFWVAAPLLLAGQRL